MTARLPDSVTPTVAPTVAPVSAGPTRVTRWWRTTRLHVVALLACASCAEDGRVLERWRVTHSLVEESQWRHVEREVDSSPVRGRLMRERLGDAGPVQLHPALEVVPPGRVRFDVPAQPAGTELRFSYGIDAPSYYADTGAVRFVALWNGERVVDETRATVSSTRFSERAWRPVVLDAAAGGTLVLETSTEEPGAAPALAGFGRLELGAVERPTARPAGVGHPNVVLVVVDTLRADRLHAYGNARELSPNLDALAARGTLFEEAYSTSPWTLPSTASLLTGLAPPRHGLGFATGQVLPFSAATLAESFADAGLDTGAFSANPLIAANRNFAQGFRSFEQRDWAKGEEVVDAALAWIAARGDDRFFLYVHLIDPHDPYEPAPDLRARFAPDAPREWKELAPPKLRARMFSGPPDEDLRARARHMADLYDGEVATVDRALGRLFAGLDAERTLIALTSDHGEEFLEHDLLGHAHQSYRETVRVPLMIAGPGVPNGERIAYRVDSRGLGATLLRLADVAPRAFPRDGDLFTQGGAPVFFGTRHGWTFDRTAARWSFSGPTWCVLDGQWFGQWSPDLPEGHGELLRLFDLRSDPDARNDVAPDAPADAARLRGLIEAWLAAAPGEEPGADRRVEPLRSGREEEALLRELGYAGDEDR